MDIMVMKMPHVRQMTSPRTGNPVPNQFLIFTEDGVYFQSYKVIIGLRKDGKFMLDITYWNFSRTTSKYLYRWMNGYGFRPTSKDMKKCSEGKLDFSNVTFRNLND